MHPSPTPTTVWASGLRRWLQAPVRKGVGSNPTAVIFQHGWMLHMQDTRRSHWRRFFFVGFDVYAHWGAQSNAQKRQRRDSNPRGQSPMDFESISLTARTHCHCRRWVGAGNAHNTRLFLRYGSEGGHQHRHLLQYNVTLRLLFVLCWCWLAHSRSTWHVAHVASGDGPRA